jgi:hypothetical protein
MRSLIQTAADGRSREIEFRGCDDDKIGLLVTIRDKDGHIELSNGTAYLFTYDEFRQFRDLANAAVSA